MGIIQTFMVIEECNKCYYSGKHYKPVLGCKCKQRIYMSGPFGKAYYVGNEYINWVLETVDGGGFNSINDKVISEEMAVSLCAFGILF